MNFYRSLKNEAAAHAAEDEKKRASIEVKNQAESLVYLAEKTLREQEGKIAQELKDGIQAKITNVKEKQAGEDLEAIQKATQELSTELQKVGQTMYNQNNGTETTQDQGNN
jgi:molecular chaperone DnaK